MWSGLLRGGSQVPLTRIRWDLPDGDFLDVDELAAASEAPRLIVLHGLESSSRSSNVLGILQRAHQRGWGGIAVNFRGCSGAPNRLRRSYHGGETGDLAWVVEKVQADYPNSPILLAGFSLGGNVLLKYLGEQAGALPASVRGAVAISAPMDLALSARGLTHGFSRVYGNRLVANLKQKTFLKLDQYPALVDADALRRVRTLEEFDDLVTGPVHGFANAEDYWAKSSSARFLPRIRRATLLINAKNDPFLPAEAIPVQAVAENAFLQGEFPDHGGHLGFLAGSNPWAIVHWAEKRAVAFLAEQLEPER